ncbi:hypothetical protein J5N97_016358 [Dioscorea zingiberensis]|uniref:Tetraspanin-19 n=1 Tax=Dioscorea zingiberensis TaxID=325984 RepID=A0A9D5CKW7_9LILI|nr:hypothetical protein J5N97_016358 [Dioscorea zingiberensis]
MVHVQLSCSRNFLVLDNLLGHIAAETANGPCLSCYTVFVSILVLLEAAITADVFLNKNWEEDFPQDSTGRLNEFKNFVSSNPDMSKWIGLSIIGAQALSIFLALVLRALGPDHGTYYESDDDVEPARLPLLRNQAQQQTLYVPDSPPSLKNSYWNGGNR